MPSTPAAPAPLCSRCQAPLNPHGARYKGVTRCRRCANRESAPGRPFTPASARDAVKAKTTQQREDKRLAADARKAGLS